MTLRGAWALATDGDEDPDGDAVAYGFKVDYPNDPLDAAFTYKYIGDAFDASMGFVPRTGVETFNPKMDYLLRPDWSWLRNMIFELSYRYVTDLDGRWESYRPETNLLQVMVRYTFRQ